MGEDLAGHAAEAGWIVGDAGCKAVGPICMAMEPGCIGEGGLDQGCRRRA